MTGTWILILTLMTSNGAAVTHVPMSSGDRCMAAGQAWLEQMQKPQPHDTWRRGFVSCVPG